MNKELLTGPYALAAFAILALVLCSGCGDTKAAAPSPQPAVPVVAASVEQKDVPVRLHAIGTVEAYSMVAVKTQITGELTGVYFKEGDDVRKGQLIFTLDKRPFEAELNRAQSNLARDEAQAANARLQQNRYQALVKAGVVSKEQYDQLESTAQAADAAVAADRAAVENAKVQLIYCSIYSPINGRTGNLIVHQGNMVKANDTIALVNINQVEPIYVTFTVPQQYLAEVRLHPYLSKEEELRLFEEYRTHGSRDAAVKLIMANLRVSVAIAAEYLHTGADHMDLIQEGNVGLMHAIKKFNPTKNVRFYAYAAWWSRAGMLRLDGRRQPLT